MKRSVLNRALAVVALSAAAVLPAHADYIGFEDLAPTLFGASSVSSGGFDFASSGAGFSGVDSEGGFFFGTAPAGSTGQFLFGLNADALTMTKTGGGSFSLQAFDFGFVPVLPYGEGTVAGLLHVVAMLEGGGTAEEDLDFGAASASGAWSFSSFTGSAFGSGVTSVTFSACLYDGAGGCDFGYSLAGFAIDNLRVPEPASAALVLAALGLLAATRRRQSL